MNFIQKRNIKGIGLLCAALLLVLVPTSLQAQEVLEEDESLSSKLTNNFVPAYYEYSSKDTIRRPSIRFENFVGKKLIFFDDFADNRHTWPHWSSLGDSALKECLGIDRNYACPGETGAMTDAYTNMKDGKKVVACFTPDQLFKYDPAVKLGKNFVVTTNPLSIKKVDKIPSKYYEGFCEHTTRIHRSFDEKDFIIETTIDQSVGHWGMVFGNFDSERPYYYFKILSDNTWAFYAVYPNNRSKPVELESGYMPVSYQSLRKLKIILKDNRQGGFKVEFWMNDDARAGSANVTRMPLKSLDVGYRLDHNSIDGNNIVIARDISIYEMPVETYLRDNVKVSGAWTGKLVKNKDSIYDVKMHMTQDQSGYVTGRITLSHSKFKDVVITKRFNARRDKNVINFEEVSGTFRGVSSNVLLHSMLLKGNMELLNPDSIVMNACLASNLHKWGEFDSRINVHSDKIYLSRVNKIEDAGPQYGAVNEEVLIQIKDLIFIPNSTTLSADKATTQSLDNLARELQRYFAENPDHMLLIHGHSDKGPDQVLSILRATSIQSELQLRGVKADILPIGHGHSSRRTPIKGDPDNRRVEVQIVQYDSCKMVDESLLIRASTTVKLIHHLPDEFILGVQLRQDPGAKAYIVLEPKGKNEPLVWEIPNIAGGERQNIKILKRYRIEEDAIILELWLDGTRYLQDTVTAYSSFSIRVTSGEVLLDHIKIFGPE